MTMNDTELELLLYHVALPPLRRGVRVKRLKARRTDPQAASFAEAELRLARVIRNRFARDGWWN